MGMEESLKRRTLTDKLISNLDSFWFALKEPIVLRFMRFLHDHEYQNGETDPLISVYIPTYNRGKILMERAVPSVLAQTYKNFELIIVGDHCTDDTEKLVLEIKDPRIRFYNIPKRGYRYPPTAENHWFAGPVVAANKALKLAQGKWIARVDDDDTWTPDHLELLLRFAQKGNYEYVTGLVERESYGKRVVWDAKRADSPYFNPGTKKVNENSPKLGATQTWFYRAYLRCLKYNINCWRKSWNRVNDIDLQYRIYKAGARIGFLEKVVAYLIPRPGEQTVGAEAYLNSEQEKVNHFKFDS